MLNDHEDDGGSEDNKNEPSADSMAELDRGEQNCWSILAQEFGLLANFVDFQENIYQKLACSAALQVF